jgi:hypothetical protein
VKIYVEGTYIEDNPVEEHWIFDLDSLAIYMKYNYFEKTGLYKVSYLSRNELEKKLQLLSPKQIKAKKVKKDVILLLMGAIFR